MSEPITDDQANEALNEIMGIADDEGEASGETKEAEPAAEAAAPAEPAAEETQVETTEEVHTDDLDSLRARNEELETAATAAETRFQERLKAHQERTVANEQILHDKFLRKSTVSDRALKMLRATRTEEGAEQTEVDQVIRELEGTMNPASASYVAPEPTPMATEDQTLVLNHFLNEKDMTSTEADEFGTWMRTEAQNVMSPQEQAVASESIGGFLRLAHGRWRDVVHEKEKENTRSDAVGAVKSVQHTQRQAARAAKALAAASESGATLEAY